MSGIRGGFTLIEIVVTLLIGTILTSIALTQYSSAQVRFAVRGARNTFAATVARARAGAVEFGTTYELRVDPDGDSVVVVRNDTIIESLHLDTEFRVDMEVSGGALILCLGPRGYADESCNSFNSEQRVTFTQNSESTSLTLLPLGQVIEGS